MEVLRVKSGHGRGRISFHARGWTGDIMEESRYRRENNASMA
jgi:hypothetical protein